MAGPHKGRFTSIQALRHFLAGLNSALKGSFLVEIKKFCFSSPSKKDFRLKTKHLSVCDAADRCGPEIAAALTSSQKALMRLSLLSSGLVQTAKQEPTSAISAQTAPRMTLVRISGAQAASLAAK